MKQLRRQIIFISLSLLLGTLIPFEKLISFFITDDLYVIKLTLNSFAKNLLFFIMLAVFFNKPLCTIRFDPKKIRIADLILLSAFAFFLCISCNIIPNIISSVVGIKANTAYKFDPSDYLTAALVPAIVEEIAFRQIITGGFSEYGTKFAVLMSSSLFALSHGNFITVLYAFLCGVILSVLYIRTRSIIVCIIVHFSCNALSVTCGAFKNPNLFYDLAVTISLILSLVIFSVLLAKRAKILPKEPKTSNISPFKTVFTTPIMIILFLIYIVNIII